MVGKKYDWEDGAELADHSKMKHQILSEYFYEYVITRCQTPKMERFRLAIVDGFAGGGRYKCGAPGSPLIFIQELHRAINDINVNRAVQNLAPIRIECTMVLNDYEPAALDSLKTHIAPVLVEYVDSSEYLSVQIDYLNDEFEKVYPRIKEYLQRGRFRNILFNLDQCGHSHVTTETLRDIMNSDNSTEIFYTFMITALLTYLQKHNPQMLERQLAHLSISKLDLDLLSEQMSNRQWLGTAENIVFSAFQKCAQFVSPFSINNPQGWRYWLIHLASSYRARQVYNNVLHKNSKSQAHFGRSGLNMLAHDPQEEGTLYLFDVNARDEAKGQLHDDIPKLISEFGDALNMAEFYGRIYNHTPAHSDDIHVTMIENPDLEIITPSGGTRRKANQIDIKDTIKLKSQTSFFPMFQRKT
ncbi:three-Cys-motif partner protein TcmP [Pseudomonas berkeleyensis]|uniref:Three-Cys-motif partner protein TcmP n=1 Tax=Pseudomonas berkeleyensis TaxID=2726956 RepID=A0A7G5DU08_9PSED|nr:three-Cys-motif partner protein TcmP [Pseudomonas berkeleyensis]QMV65233.1 three-Cys-motif partner protein TcmP [Pseudomonas berkeleyensis]WSO40710.1 three-Cys-motif partner protein TcmP [Pseudomonas berkeleyensis]